MNQTRGNDTIVKEIAIKASAQRVFDALTDPRQRAEWWGIEGKFKVTDMHSDLRVGGAWSMRGLGMGGNPFTIRGEYRAIDPPRLLEFTWRPDWQEPQTLVRFDLEEQDGVTTLRLTHSALTSEHFEKYQGWPSLLASLRQFAEVKVADQFTS
jgi:uncharacterized protein YndB with AHSA1/START domain